MQQKKKEICANCINFDFNTPHTGYCNNKNQNMISNMSCGDYEELK